ncbi:MAG TPA: T9SS type A sorting domain-containing protein [Bacteroidales bacterium]|nr:T9SS type A sorting domain-containing protein [Bacteroidales bacterium]
MIDNVGFPEDWDYALRKIVIDDENPDILYLVTYRDVFRSMDEGENWANIHYSDISPWNSDDKHKGFFDFKITPWDEIRTAYLAGSKIYRIKGLENNEPEFIDISTDVLDIPNAGTRHGNPLRCEISMDKKFENMVWFFYTCEYDKGIGKSRFYRIVKFDGTAYSLIYEEGQSILAGYSDFKLEFNVSPSNQSVFYAGGTSIEKIKLLPNPTSNTMKDGTYPDDNCWVHDDIRDMQIFSDGTHDTLFIADNSGISWGTAFETGQTTCNYDFVWHWRHPCNSIENGLNITELYGIGIFNKSSELVAGGCQDLGHMLLNTDDWINFGGGDGSEIVWDTEEMNIFYYSEWQSGSISRTNDFGATSSSINSPTFGETGLFIPLELDPINNSILYSGKKELIKFSGVNDFNGNNITVETLYTLPHDSISDIEVVRSGNSRRIYFSTLRAYYDWAPPPIEGFENCLFKSIGDGNNLTFVDIGKNLDGCDGGFINDIEVKPDAISTIWVSFAVYSFDGDPKVFRTLDEGAHWEDYSPGLPPGLPVFKLKYDSRYGNLYAATDVGVFVRNVNSSEEWYPFNSNLPQKIVTDLEINPDFNAIYAATYGRGLWKSPLHCIYNSEPFYVNDDHLIWTTNQIREQTIIIPAGKILEIRNCTVFMPSDAKIVVERGGQLILDGGTLTSACNDLWWGVELQGDSRNIQTEQYQGKIIMRNEAVIEDARKAIFCGKNIENTYPDWNYTGGIIDATSSTLQNNKFGILIWRYNDQDRDYNCTLSECNFLTTKALKDGLPPRYFLTLIQVKGVTVEACDFINSVPDNIDYQDRGTGIFAYDGGFTVTYISIPGQIKRSKFKKLNYGILALNYEQDQPFVVNNTYFINNLTGVYASGLSEILLYDNDFTVPRAGYPTNRIFGGVYMNYCTGYTITENHYNGITPGGETNVGITVNNSGEDFNDIYKNYFTNMFIGILAQNINKSENDRQGLYILCNEFTTNEYDITVTADPWCSDLCGIARNQGTLAVPAGNLFSKTGIHDFSDYNNEKEWIDYYHHAVPLQGECPWKPEHYSRQTISLHGTDETYSPCPPLDFDLEDKIATINQYNASTILIDSLEAEKTQLVDGGSTIELNLEISQAQPSEAVELNDELLENSPYLSDTVLINVAGKEDVLLTEMVTDIMIANPQSAKSESVLEALESRENPLTEEMMDAILAGRDTVSEKETLEADLSHAGLQRELALNRLIDIFRQDSIDSRTDSIINLLQNHPTLSAKYRLMMIYLGQGDSIAARSTLDSIPAQFSMTSRQSIIHDHWNEWVDFILELQADSSNITDADSLQMALLLILSQNEDLPGCIANNALQFLSWTETEPHYVLPGDLLKNNPVRIKSGKEKNSETKSTIKLYPNPASGYIIVEYLPNQKSYNGLLQIFTSAGRLYYAMELNNNKHFQFIDTKDWPGGIYFYKYSCENSKAENGKIIIIK